MGALDLSYGLGLSRRRFAGAGSGPDPERLQTLVTEATATPSATLITLASGQNGLRVFTDHPAASEDFFFLYVSKNGGAVVKHRMFRWTGRIIPGVAGDTFALGTADGRSLRCAGIIVPASLTTPSGVTGTVNCDQAVPPLWTPTAAHVVLPTKGACMVLEADGTERILYIRERDPHGNWTPIRWVRHDASRDTVVQCSYREVAIANFTGATISATGPTGSTVGGTKVVQSLTFPTVTGATRNVSDLTGLNAAIAAAVSGDEIVLAAGTYANSDITRGSFVANEAAGFYGMEGITIRGATGVAADVVLTGPVTINQPGAGPTMTARGGWRDLIFNFGANNYKFHLGGGRYTIQNARFTGGSAADSFDGEATICPLLLDCLWVQVDTSADDCWNFNGSATYNASCLIRLMGCIGFASGANVASQVHTSHNGLATEIYDGLWYDAFANVFANDANTTPTYVFFGTVDKGARRAGILDGVVLHGTFWLNGDSTGTGPKSRFVHATTALATSGTALYRNTMSVEDSLLNVTVGRAIFNSLGGGNLEGNIIVGSAEGIRLGNAAGAVASTGIKRNAAVGCSQAYAFIDVSNMPANFKNNGAKTSGTSVNVPTGGMAAITTAGNVLDPTVDADFTPGTGDVTGADAGLDSSYIPTAAGNADGTGQTDVVDWVGGSDPWGFVSIYKSSRAPKGAREIPAIYASADLYPDFF
jgi:hypothetical protein